MDNVENISFEQAPANSVPRCPYCKEKLERIWVKLAGLGIKGLTEICMCPHCEAFLAYNAWKR